MEDVWPQVKAIITDSRIWSMTFVLVGWPAVGMLAGAELVLEPAVPLVYAYLSVLHAIGQGFPGSYAFWAGFALFCFSIASVLVGAFDWARVRRGTSQRPERKSPVND